MSKVKKMAQDLVGDTQFREGRNDNDTVRLWENYREQALLWRAIAFLQIPVSFICVVFAIVMWFSRDIILNVPEKPAPGVYSAYEIRDVEFITFANQYVNLIATYNFTTAERQFNEAQKYLVEPVLSKFQVEMTDQELNTVKQTRRSQTFWVDPEKTKIERTEDDRQVIVTLQGNREKRVGEKAAPEVESIYQVTLETQPNNTFNPYGIVISNVAVENKTIGGQQ